MSEAAPSEGFGSIPRNGAPPRSRVPEPGSGPAPHPVIEEGRPIDGPASRHPPHPTQNLVLRVVTEDGILDKAGHGQAIAERRVELLDYMPLAERVGDAALLTLIAMCKFSSRDEQGRLVCKMGAGAIGELRRGWRKDKKTKELVLKPLGRQAVADHIAKLKAENILRHEGERDPATGEWAVHAYVIYPLCDAPPDEKLSVLPRRGTDDGGDTGAKSLDSATAEKSDTGAPALGSTTAGKDDTGHPTVVDDPVLTRGDTGDLQEILPVSPLGDAGPTRQNDVPAVDEENSNLSNGDDTGAEFVAVVARLIAADVEAGKAARLAREDIHECVRQLDWLPLREQLAVKSGKPIRNRGAYLVSAIEGGYPEPQTPAASPTAARPGSPPEPEAEEPWLREAEAVFAQLAAGEQERRIGVERDALLAGSAASWFAKSELMLETVSRSSAVHTLAVELGLAEPEAA